MRRAYALLMSGAVALAGCRTEVQPAERQPARTVRVSSPERPDGSAAGPARPQSQAPARPQTPAPGPGTPSTPEPAQVVADDPCAARLHEIAGTMLLYYALNKRLPAELDELRAVADFDQALSFTCPASGRPYVYVPSGLRFPGKEERLVLHDAEPSHDGGRWGILAAPPRGKRPAATWAVHLPEDVFAKYVAPGVPLQGE